MPKDKAEKEAVATAKKPVDDGRVAKLEAFAAAAVKFIGTLDKKAAIRLGGMLSCLLLVVNVSVAQTVGWQPIDSTKGTANITYTGGAATLNIDNVAVGTDLTVAGDLTVTGATGGTGDLSVSNVVATGSADIAGDIILANDETIDNATDAEVRITANDDAALLLEVALESENAVANIADNDYMQISMTAYDSATNAQEYASIDLIATDVTTATEDSRIDLNFLAGGAAKEVQVGAANDGTMAMTLPAAMELSVDGKYAPVGPDATTALMIQTDSDTLGAGGSVTGTFAVAFGAAPVVVGSYTSAPSTTNLYFTAITTTNYVATGSASDTFSVIAVGQRP